MAEHGDSAAQGGGGFKAWVVALAFCLGAALAAVIVLATPLGKGGQAATPTSDAVATDSGAAADEASSAQGLPANASMAQVVATSFPSWNADSPTLAKLISYVDEVTNEASPDYIEPVDRVATFDMDGTILCEKAPIYVDYTMLIHRVLDDPTYTASQDLIDLCTQLRANADKGIVDDALDAQKAVAWGKAFAGMTPDDFQAYVRQYLATTDVQGFAGMTYGESFYQPMLEVIDYLQVHDFDVWMVSACERDVVRAAVKDFGIEPDHVVGTDTRMVATGQGDVDGADYTFALDDTLVYGDNLLDLAAKNNKVIGIYREIGRRPVLAFGNSSGDFAMLNYAQANPEHKGMGLFVVCDDTVREYGNDEKAADYRETVAANGWAGISMRDDWATIYGPGVERTQLPAAAPAEATSAAAEATAAAETSADAEEAPADAEAPAEESAEEELAQAA